MTKSRQATLFVAVALVATVAGFLVNPLARQPEVDTGGLLAAALPDLQGERRSIDQWRGKVVVVNFWATWCPPCLEEIPELVRMQARLGAKGLQVVGIAVDTEANVREFARNQPFNYPLLVGNAEAIELARQAGNVRGGLPYTVVLDRSGRPMRTFSGVLSEAKLAPLVFPMLAE
jgi:thiol-disulfide isomerase/thioredoxin